MFSTYSKTNVHFSVTFILSSANSLNLDQSKILSFGKELTLPNIEIVDQSKLKAFADNKIDPTQKWNLFWKEKKTMWEKQKKAGFQHFLLFTRCF